MSKKNMEYTVVKTSGYCKNHRECLYKFLDYPKELLNHTYAIFKNNDGKPIVINDDIKKEYTNDIVLLGYTDRVTAKKFIHDWNSSPFQCCPQDSPRKGRCVKNLSSCYETGLMMSSRHRSLTPQELLKIKIDAGLIPSYSECLKDSDCKLKYKVSWRDNYRYVCNSQHRCKKKIKHRQSTKSRYKKGKSLAQLAKEIAEKDN